MGPVESSDLFKPWAPHRPRWADRSSRRSSLASSTVTASPTALSARSRHRPTAATTHSRWCTYSPPRASSHHSPEFSRVDTSSRGSGADEAGDRVGGFADLGVGCGAPFPDGVGDKSRWSTPWQTVGRWSCTDDVVRRVRRMAWRGTRLIENGARAAEGSNAAHVDACGRLRARRPSLAAVTAVCARARRRGCWRGVEVFGQVRQAGVGDARVDWCDGVVVEEDRPRRRPAGGS